MTIKLKPTFTLCGNYITPVEYHGHCDTTPIDHAWVVMFRDSAGTVEEVVCCRNGKSYPAETVRVAPGECWQTAAHERFVANGWTSPWEVVP